MMDEEKEQKLKNKYRKHTNRMMKKAITDAKTMSREKETIGPTAAALFQHRTSPYHYWKQKTLRKQIEKSAKKKP